MKDPNEFTWLYALALRNRDKELMKSLYHPDIVFFDLWNEYSLKGKAAIGAMIDDWFDSIGTENVAADFENVESSVGDTVGFTNCFVRFSVRSDRGTEIRHIKERMTVCLIRENGEWLVTNQHTSIPVKPETGAGIFE